MGRHKNLQPDFPPFHRRKVVKKNQKAGTGALDFYLPGRGFCPGGTHNKTRRKKNGGYVLNPFGGTQEASQGEKGKKGSLWGGGG